MGKITEYVRKSHSFTKEALDDLGILSRYMGDIGESAVLRYLIINEIRKVPAFQKEMRITLTDEDAKKLRTVMGNAEPEVVTKVYSEAELNHQIELAKQGLPSIFPERTEE